MDDAQCVPDTVVQGHQYTHRERVVSPLAYPYPRSLASSHHLGVPVCSGGPDRLDERARLDQLARETSRLDDELRMEFSEL